MTFDILGPGKLDFTLNPKKLVLTWGDLKGGGIFKPKSTVIEIFENKIKR